jgi:hypothetical protein
MVGNLIIALNVRQLNISFEVAEPFAIAGYVTAALLFIGTLIYGIKLLKTDRLPKTD